MSGETLTEDKAEFLGRIDVMCILLGEIIAATPDPAGLLQKSRKMFVDSQSEIMKSHASGASYIDSGNSVIDLVEWYANYRTQFDKRP